MEASKITRKPRLILSRKRSARDMPIPNLKLYHRDTVCDSIALAQKLVCRPVGEKREFRNKPT